jgi:hypothetical protein
MALRSSLLFCSLMLLVTGCSTTTQIQTTPPRPALTTHPDTITTTDMARLTVTVDIGRTELPEDVQAMQFRIAEVHLKAADNTWTTYPADINSFEISSGTRTRKIVLSTQISPATYDSLGLVLSDIFVFYTANAGGPLTMPGDAPLLLPLGAQLTTETPTTLELLFEPGASLSRTPACQWFFLPFFEVKLAG